MKREGAKRKPKRGISQRRKARLDRLVAEAVVDCYNDSEEVTGLYTMIENNLAMRSKRCCSGCPSRCCAST